MVSFHSYVNAGSVDDPSGETGIAHMFEHMAFKGTETIGTKNWPAGERRMDEVEHVYDQLRRERNKGVKADPKKLEDLQTAAEGRHRKGRQLRDSECLYPN